MKAVLTGPGTPGLPIDAGVIGVSDPGGLWGGLTDLQAILEALGLGTLPTGFLRTILGGVGEVQDLGTLGAAPVIDLANANLFLGELDQDCTVTMVGWTNLKDCQITVIVWEDGTGGWTPTFSGVTWDGGGGTPTHDTTVGTFTRYVFTSHDGGTTIIGAKTGGGGGSSLTPATTVTDETTFGIAPAVGTDTEYARQDHTHGSPALSEIENAGHYEVLMDGGSPYEPLDDGSGTDWLWVWVPG